jgi:cyclic pyranopterin phosphate synthase
MPEHGSAFVPRADILSYEEMTRLAGIFVSLGVKKIRVTGGEPLVRKDLAELVGMLAALDGAPQLALTTNGVALAEQAAGLHAAGLRRLNVHLDTLDAARLEQIARRDELGRVLEGLEEARRLGFGPIKINAVAIKGLTEPDIVPLAHFGREHGYEVRFIEFMPLDAQGIWDLARVLTADEIVRAIEAGVGPLEAEPDADPRAPALAYRYRDGGGRVGLIASVSRPFCQRCGRLRLTADGALRYCLFALEETDLKGPLRAGASELEIAALIGSTVARKWAGHEIQTAHFVAPPRPMNAIGG